MTRRNLLVECVMAMVAGKKPPVSTPYLAQRGDRALSLTIGCSTRHWPDPFARAKSSLFLKIHGLFERELAEQNGRLDPLRMDITTDAGKPFDNHPRLKNSAPLFDITIIHPCAGQFGECSTPSRKHLADAVERKKNKYRGSFPVTYSLLPLAMSTCDEVGSDVYTLIKELTRRRVDHRSETNSNDFQHLVEGTEVARLRRRFFFVLHQALSFRTRHHPCRQGVALASTRQLPSQGPVSIHAHRIEGVTGSAGRKGANGVGGRI